MGKRDLKNYLSELSQQQIQEQVLDLYTKFPDVKKYYDFVFNPNEAQLLREAKIKINAEYFPVKSKRPKMRRSVAQKIVKHFITLGVDGFIIADVMLYNIELGMTFSNGNRIKNDAFYNSFFTSFVQSITFMIERSLVNSHTSRLEKIVADVNDLNWPNKHEFSSVIERLNY